MFASEDVFEIVPDIITAAKGLTSGYQPLAQQFYQTKFTKLYLKKG